jgi:hypothetical protein
VMHLKEKLDMGPLHADYKNTKAHMLDPRIRLQEMIMSS